jgi:antitoxin (DNA-binding transcriptional repressor) of toxin-antitoxin stability system
MLIDTNQIITKTQLRKNLTDILMLVREGKELIVSDRGELVAKMSPIMAKKKTRNVSQFMAEVKQLREKLSRQNPNFDSLKSLREMRREN